MIKRISLLMVAALMAAMMMVATAAPAFADPKPCGTEGGPGGCRTFEDTTTNNPNDEIQNTGSKPKPNGPHACNPPGASDNYEKCARD